MDSWGVSTYGDPCRECGYRWDSTEEQAMAVVAEAPGRFREATVGATGFERLPELGWTVTGYVTHVADNLSIWAERVAGVAAGATPRLVGYDEDALAEARRYNELALLGALWRLEQAAAEWLEVIDQLPPGVLMAHPERGLITRIDVKRANAHDAQHHLWDIVRTLEPSERPSEEPVEQRSGALTEQPVDHPPGEPPPDATDG